MNKVNIRITLFALITGMFLVVVSGCGYRCQGWAYRTAYRQVCKSYSSNGHCSFWGSESYQERYCTRWIKDPDPKKATYSEPRPVPKTHATSKKKPVPQTSSVVTKYFITKAGKSHFPKNVKKPTHGETYLLSEVTPFLCEIAKSGIRKTVNSMGGTYKNEKTKSGGKKYKYVQFSTSKFIGEFFPKESYGSNSCSIYQPNYRPWPFSKDELVDWLSSMGFDVFRNGNYIVGGKDFKGRGAYKPDKLYYLNYTSSIETVMSKHGPGTSIRVRWIMKSEAMAALCKLGENKWYQKSFDEYRNMTKNK